MQHQAAAARVVVDRGLRRDSVLTTTGVALPPPVMLPAKPGTTALAGASCEQHDGSTMFTNGCFMPLSCGLKETAPPEFPRAGPFLSSNQSTCSGLLDLPDADLARQADGRPDAESSV